MSTIDLCFNSICHQRKLGMLFNVPPSRFTPPNPYIQFPQFTKMQFDMRRKAEILKYNANKSNTKTNNLTKNQKKALLLSGAGQKQSYPDIYLTQETIGANDNISYENITVKYPDSSIRIYDNSQNIFQYIIIPNGRLCGNDGQIQTPTSSSDVPGSIQNLYYDPSVPLYNYATRIDNYGIQNVPIKNDLWSLYSSNNIYINSITGTSICKLKILDSIDSYGYTFTIKTPVAFYTSGTPNTVSSNNNLIDISSSVVILPQNISVYYNNTIVPLDHPPTVTFNANNNTRIGYTINYNESYSMIVYLGILTISDLYLYTSPGFIYDIHINYNIIHNYSSNLYYGYYQNPSSGIICNLTSMPTTLPQNVNIYSSNNSEFTTDGLSITGL